MESEEATFMEAHKIQRNYSITLIFKIYSLVSVNSSQKP